MKRLAAVLLFLFSCCQWVPRLPAQEWSLSTDLGAYSVVGLAALDSGDVWGIAGNLSGQGRLFHYDGASWALETAVYAVQTGELRGIRAYDATHVWAVGDNSSAGMIYYFNGSSWIVQTTILYATWLNDVFAADSNNVWAVGANIYRSLDGGADWTFVTNPTYLWQGIDGTDNSHIWAVGGPYAGPEQILFFDGSSWSLQYEVDWGMGTNLRDICAVSQTDVWAVGDKGYILHYDGSEWSVFTQLVSVHGDPVDMFSIADRDAQSIWAGGDYGYVYYFNGSDWALAGDLSGSRIDSLGLCPGGIWAGDGGGNIFRGELSSGSRSWIHDYDGDGTSDIAVFRGSTGMWSVRDLTRAYFGNSTDSLVPADYDGDGTTDIAVFRGTSGMWSVRGLTRFYLGAANDQPATGDYNGDGVAEAGIFRESSGLWSIRDLTRIYLGSTGDTVIPGYYDADSARDIAIFRGSSGMWSVRNLTRFYFGSSTDDLVPGDYTGAGRWEAGIFRPSTGMWSIRNVTRVYLGSTGDRALPADYDGDGVDEAGVFRDTAGMWSVRDLTRVYFGATGDAPVTR